MALVAFAAVAGVARPAADTPASRPSQLSGKVGSSSGAAGTIMLGVVLKNVSHTTCTLRGYPALRLYRPHRWVPTHVSHGGLVPLNRHVRTIVLHPGGRASLLVAYHDVPIGNAPCLTSTSLFVLSHGSVDGVPVSIRAMACNGDLRISPLLAGVVSAR
jgi:hypothetical protein